MTKDRLLELLRENIQEGNPRLKWEVHSILICDIVSTNSRALVNLGCRSGPLLKVLSKPRVPETKQGNASISNKATTLETKDNNES
jgi:hypothetical protein